MGFSKFRSISLVGERGRCVLDVIQAEQCRWKMKMKRKLEFEMVVY